MTTMRRIALLALGASALPLAAAAEPRQWVYGAAESAATEADDRGWFEAVAAEAPVSVQAVIRRRRAPPPPPPPPPPPTGGSRIVVAIVDTGVDRDHPEFAGRIVGGTCFGGASVCSGAAALGDDDHGHGTHVAGIVAAAANGVGNTGVAPNAAILPVKVLAANGSGSDLSVVNGITYAVNQGARVINMSLGGPSPSSVYLAPLQQAAASAVIVAAAGNGGNALAPGYPAAYATQAGIVGSMIIVGSVGPTNAISSFSQTPGNGGCVASGGKTTCFKDVFLVAPGQSIYSAYTGGGYASMSGTSMATPYVSGVAARVFAASPYLTAQQVASILFQSATDLGASGVDAVYGRGLVNLQAALAPLGTQSIATSGTTTASYSGTGNVGAAGLSGALGYGLGASKIAKKAVFFDAFGRDYRTDLTAAVGNAALSLEGLVSQGTGLWRSVDFTSDGFSVAGFVSDDSTNAVLGAARHTALSDVVMRARLSDGATLIFGHNAAPQGQLNALDLAASDAYEGLFLSASALNSPFVALTEDADFLGARVAVSDTLAFTFGHARAEGNATLGLEDEVLTVEESIGYLTQDPSHLRSAENTAAAVTWRFAPWGVAGINVARTDEANSLLGSGEAGALALTSDAATTSVGFGVRLNLSEDWIATASWSRGSTEATPYANGLAQRFSGIESQAFGVALAKRGVFGDEDSLGLAVSRPLHITSGTAVVTASTGVTDTREIVYTTEVLNLASPTPETDFELGYSARVGEALTLQTSAMYQQNAGGVQGEDAVAAFVALKGSW